MILSGSQILKELNHSIFISPFEESRLNSNSYNLSLSNRLVIYKDQYLDMKKKYSPDDMQQIEIPEDGIVLEPNKLYLGSTNELTYTTKYIPVIEGRSSLARLGLFVHITAGLGETGFKGHWTLELSCVQPVRIYPNVQICQILFCCTKGKKDKCRSKKYQFSQEAEPSKIAMEISKEG